MWPDRSSVEAFVRSSQAPSMAVELPSGDVFAANDAAVAAIGIEADALQGARAVDLVRAQERPGAQAALALLAQGVLTGFQAVRDVDSGKYSGLTVAVWVSALDVGNERFGLVSFAPLDNAATPMERRGEPGLQQPLGEFVLGTVDSDWRVDRISSDVGDLLGFEPDEVRGSPMLGAVHPSDAPSLLASISHAYQAQRAVCVPVRLRNRSGNWLRVSAVLAALSGTDPPPLGFALMRPTTEAASKGSASRAGELEQHMLRIADELRAAGIISRLDRLPDRARVPELSRLTAREWEIVTRLLDGERVPAIARELFVSQSTIRSNLSSIFAKVGVHSQPELIHRLRSET